MYLDLKVLLLDRVMLVIFFRHVILHHLGFLFGLLHRAYELIVSFLGLLELHNLVRPPPQPLLLLNLPGGLIGLTEILGNLTLHILLHSNNCLVHVILVVNDRTPCCHLTRLVINRDFS